MKETARKRRNGNTRKNIVKKERKVQLGSLIFLYIGQ